MLNRETRNLLIHIGITGLLILAFLRLLAGCGV